MRKLLTSVKMENENVFGKSFAGPSPHVHILMHWFIRLIKDERMRIGRIKDRDDVIWVISGVVLPLGAGWRRHAVSLSEINYSRDG